MALKINVYKVLNFIKRSQTNLDLLRSIISLMPPSKQYFYYVEIKINIW
jgi:hypothetical protein